MTRSHHRRVKTRRVRILTTALAITLACTLSLAAQDTHQETPLSAGQLGTVLKLRQARPKRPAPLFLFTDPNKDPDDLGVLVTTRFLQKQQLVDLRCAVTTLGNRETRIKRAMFTRAVLDQLGMETVKVGVGVDYRFEVELTTGAVDVKATDGRKKDHQAFIETSLLPSEAVVEIDGLALLKNELERVPDHSAVLLINAGMVDMAALLRDRPNLVKQKTALVVIMGGVEPEPDRRGFLVADKRAYNNTTHQSSADYTYSRVQELGLPLVVVNKEAAYATAVPRSYYDGLAATGHPIGVYLKDQQMQSLQNLWSGINQGRIPGLTTNWFFETFTDIKPSTAVGKATIASAIANPDDFPVLWKQVNKLNLYDPLALLAATPGARDLLFYPNGHDRWQVVGAKLIKDPSIVKYVLAGVAIESLRAPVPAKSRTGTAPGYPKRRHVDEQDAPWIKNLPNYEPLEYTAETVYQHEGQWADPRDSRDVKRTFITRVGSREFPVSIDDNGRPLNPLGRTGLRGRGLLGRWGRNSAGDPLLTRVHPETTRLQVLIIERKDSGQLALPGGMADTGEDIADTAARELLEETGAVLNFKNATLLFVGVVDDPRNTDNAWMETSVLHKHLTEIEQKSMALKAGDDATAVRWADVNQELLSSMYASHGQYICLALLNLKDVPEIADQVNDLLK